MTEYFHDFLPVHHLFDKSIHISQIDLLLEEILSAPSGSRLRTEQHHADHQKRHDRQRNVQNEHTDKHAHYRKTTVDDLGNTLADHLAQRIDIIRIDRHDVAVRMVVKIFDRQFFHMFKHRITNFF